MYFIYILESERTGQYYIGSGEDVQERLMRHNRGSIFSTKKFRPYKIVFQQGFESKSLARSIELRLKNLKRRDYLSKIINDGHIKLVEKLKKNL